MSAKINTTGQLRSFLAEKLIDLSEGRLAPEKAVQITKMSAQITESFYSELKAQRVAKELKSDIPSLGDLNLGGKSDKSEIAAGNQTKSA